MEEGLWNQSATRSPNGPPRYYTTGLQLVVAIGKLATQQRGSQISFDKEKSVLLGTLRAWPPFLP